MEQKRHREATMRTILCVPVMDD